jgi:nucleoside-diphosphate-sugar epimerase
MTCVLVTGSSGFVGSAICEALTERGIDVVGYDLKPSRFTSAPWPKQTRFRAGDIRDLDALESVLTDNEVTHIVHAAALTPDEQRERSHPDLIAEVNVLGSARLAMAVAKRRPQCRLLHLSSIAVYGEAEPGEEGRFHEETTSPRPVALYGVTKFAAEMIMRRLAALHGLDICIARLGPLFGPWEHASGARDILSPHHQIAIAARNGAPCILPRNVAADWLYSREAARKIVGLLIAGNVQHHLLNLGGGEMSTLVDWCEALRGLIPGFEWREDAAAPTIRYGYCKDRPALATTRLDAIVPPQAPTLTDAARDHLSWLDRFKQHLMEPTT